MIAVFLIGAAVVLLLYGSYYERHWFRALQVSVLFSQPHVYAAETLELAEIIENRKKLALPVIEIGFRVPRGLQFTDADNTLESDYIYKRDLFAVSGMERIVRRYHMTAMKRGFYSVTQLTCHAPSRLFRRIYMMDRASQEEIGGLFVYPARVNCSLLLRAVEVILGERESARKAYEDPFAFSAIRPYTIQDPMKTINWKATARTGSLMINTYASTSALRVRVFLDVSRDPGNPFADSLREFGIAMAASLIRNLVNGQMDASLLVNCRPLWKNASGDVTFFPSCMSAGGLTAVEEFLTADFDASACLPFEKMILLAAGRTVAPHGKSGSRIAENRIAEGHTAGDRITEDRIAEDHTAGDHIAEDRIAKGHTAGDRIAEGHNTEGYKARDAAIQLTGSDDEISIFLTHSDRPALRNAIHGFLGTRRSGILAVLCRTADRRREKHERNLHILPVCNVN